MADCGGFVSKNNSVHSRCLATDWNHSWVLCEYRQMQSPAICYSLQCTAEEVFALQRIALPLYTNSSWSIVLRQLPPIYSSINDYIQTHPPKCTPVRPTVAPVLSCCLTQPQVLPPEGLLILGDAYCNFNPIYGQGMTVAAIEASILESILTQRQSKSLTPQGASRDDQLTDNHDVDTKNGSSMDFSGLAKEFYPAAAPVVAHSWLMAALRDLTYPFATSENESVTWSQRLLMGYADVICKLATFDTEVGFDVIHGYRYQRYEYRFESLFHMCLTQQDQTATANWDQYIDDLHMYGTWNIGGCTGVLNQL